MMLTSTMSDRAQTLKKIKKASGITNEDMAREIGVTLNTIHRWLNIGDEPKSKAVIGNVDRFIGKNSQFLKK